MTSFVRHFTLAQANALLPLATEQCGRLRSLLQEERTLRERLKRGAILVAAEGEEPTADEEHVEAQLRIINDKVEASMAALHLLGAQVKGLDPFLLDFPALLKGRTVLLCWKEGEPGITHQHEVDTGFSSRKPIADPRAFGKDLLQ